MVFNLNLTSTDGIAFEHVGGDMAPYKLGHLPPPPLRETCDLSLHIYVINLVRFKVYFFQKYECIAWVQETSKFVNPKCTFIHYSLWSLIRMR